MAPPTKKLKLSGPVLPPDLWAKALDYLYFDEALPLTAVSKSFLREVPPLVKRLRVRSGESMAVSSVAAARFCGVEDVHVFSFTDSGYIAHDMGNLPPEVRLDEHTYHLDEATLRNVVPFLSNLPKLEFCYLGSPSTKESEVRATRFTRWSTTVEFGEHRMFHEEKVATLLESACLAFSQGRLSQQFALGRWVPSQLAPEGRRCMWKKNSDGAELECRMCNMLCQNIAPLDVMKLDDRQIPCIPESERMRIATSRNKDRCQSMLTDVLVDELVHLGGSAIVIPPDYSTEYRQTHCKESKCSKLKSLISAGANAKDGRIRQTLVERCEKGLDRPFGNGKPARTFAGGKRIMSIESYRRLEDLGFDICESDFLLVDTSDNRTNWHLFMFRKDKAQLDPEKARLAKERFQAAFNVDMEEVKQRIKRSIASGDILYLLTEMKVHWRLAEWLNISIADLKEHKEAVKALILESGSWE
ncbi:hypothetical protein ACHAXT_012136 [Thalassiosira profunda]